MQRFFCTEQLSLRARLTGWTSCSNVSRDDVLAVTDVDVAAHEVGAQNLGDVRTPNVTPVTLVDFFVALDWKNFLI